MWESEIRRIKVPVQAKPHLKETNLGMPVISARQKA
jgi:hypothetical protein